MPCTTKERRTTQELFPAPLATNNNCHTYIGVFKVPFSNEFSRGFVFISMTNWVDFRLSKNTKKKGCKEYQHFGRYYHVHKRNHVAGIDLSQSILRLLSQENYTVGTNLFIVTALNNDEAQVNVRLKDTERLTPSIIREEREAGWVVAAEFLFRKELVAKYCR